VRSETLAKRFYRTIGARGLQDITLAEKTRADVRLAKSLVTGGKRILDLGCGYGRIAIPLARGGPQITGIDIAQELIAAAKRAARQAKVRVRFDVGSMLKLPYRDGSFDRVICLWSSFSHLLNRRDQLTAIDEMHRVLAPGGVAYIEVVNAGTAALKRRLERAGLGPDKRLSRFAVGSGEITIYNHDRNSLQSVVERSDFKRFRVGLKNAFGHRRLTAWLCREQP
jgi:ubiquinone/menaquinone biosynthesis C-methylase UbiE